MADQQPSSGSSAASGPGSSAGAGKASGTSGGSSRGWIVLGVGCVAAALPLVPPAGALGLGIVVGLAALVGPGSAATWGKKVSRWLIQGCVVLLGLRIDLHRLMDAAASGIGLAVATIAAAMGLGLAIGRLLRCEDEAAVLVTSGTAICGGSAIAAVGATIRAAPGTMAIATGAVFVLNAAAMLTMPSIGRAMGLSAEQFGVWAGIAIHDVASVGGAARAFAGGGGGEGAAAIDTANVTKLARVIWIVPVALLASWWMARARARAGTTTEAGGVRGAAFPWFILGFIAASAARTIFPDVASVEGSIKAVAGAGFQVALFLIGTGVSLAAIRGAGWRVLGLAVSLWLLLAGGTLGAILLLV